MAEKIFSGGTGPGGAWWGMGWQASSAIPVAQDHCSSGKHQRPGGLLFSSPHGSLYNSLFLAMPQTPCLPLLCECTMESFSALSPRVTWQLSLLDLPTPALPQHSLAGPSFLEQQDRLPVPSTLSPPGGTSYDIPTCPCADSRQNCHCRTAFPFRVVMKIEKAQAAVCVGS